MLLSQQRIKLLFLYSMLTYPLLAGAMCGDLFNKAKDNANFSFTIDRSMEFDLNVDEYMDKANVKSEGGKIPEGAPEVKVPVDIPPQDFSIKDNPDVQKYGSKLRYVDIKMSKISVVSNTANVAIPPITVMMSPFKQNSFKVVGTYSGVAPGQTGKSEDLIKDAAARSYISSLFLAFEFNTKGSATMVLKGGQAVPKGKVRLKVDFQLTLSINPFK